MAVGRLPWFILLFTLIVGAQAGLISVSGYSAFKAQSAGAAKVVLLIIGKDCQYCPQIQGIVSSKCAANPDIKCFVDDIGDVDGAFDDSYQSTQYSVGYIPYVAFVLNGQLKSALKDGHASKGPDTVNAGFAGLGAK